MYIYVVAAKNKGFLWEKISQEGYRTLKDAQTFIESRSDSPKQLAEFKYQSETTVYNIYEIKLKD